MISLFKTVRIELKKLRRLKINLVGFVSAVLSVIISSIQLLTVSNAEREFSILEGNIIWNNITLLMPFTIALIGGYYINREYVEDTQKNILLVPVKWRKIINSKVILIFLFGTFLGMAEWILCIVASMVWRCKGMSIGLLLSSLGAMLTIHLCIVIAILPIVLIASSKKGMYIWGALIAMVSGVLVVFVSNGKGVSIYPLSAGLSLIQFRRIPSEFLIRENAIICLLILCLVSYIVYRFLYHKKDNCY